MHHNTADSLWNCLSQRLAQIGLIPHDVGGSGDCFFKSVSHQLYGTADLHVEVLMVGISHLDNYPELYIESSALTHSLIKLLTLIPSAFKHTTLLYQFINIENSTTFLQSLYKHHKRCKENC